MAVAIDLSGNVTLVTGGATGIGAGVVRQFAQAGSAVFFSYTGNAQGAEALVAELKAAGHRVGSAHADFSDPQAPGQLVATAERELGPIDHLVNVAGITDPHPCLEITPEIWDRTLNINLRGTFFVSQAVARSLIQRGRREASIVLMGSVHGRVAAPGHAHYEASKGGLNMLTRALAVDLGPHGIRVNCVAPGAIEVERYAHMANYDPVTWGQQIPLRRVGFPADIAPLCLFLCSPGASYLSGQVIYVDGALTNRLLL